MCSLVEVLIQTAGVTSRSGSKERTAVSGARERMKREARRRETERARCSGVQSEICSVDVNKKKVFDFTP